MKPAVSHDGLLDALDIGGLRPPFPPPPPTPKWYVPWSVRPMGHRPHPSFSPRALPSLEHPVLDETPTAITATPATRSIELIDLRVAQSYGDKFVTGVTDPFTLAHDWGRGVPWRSQLYGGDVFEKSDTPRWTSVPSLPAAPAAPLLRDLDSFTDGTTAGSFDFSLPPDSPRIPFRQLEPDDSLPLCGEDPAPYSIETWREDVLLSAGHDEGYEVESRDSSRGVKRHRSCAFSEGGYDEQLRTRDTCQGSPIRWACRGNCQSVERQEYPQRFPGTQGRCACMTWAS
jgi:hypothetical protein